METTTSTEIADLLDRQVRSTTALVVTADRTPISYGALATMVDEVAGRLRGAGLRRGDPVGLVCADNAEFVVGLLGAARAGGVVAPLDPALPPAELAARVGAVGARAVITTGPGQAAIPSWPLRVDAAAATATLDTTAPPGPRHANHGLTDDDSLVLFTAGTTNRAKAVPLTHANVAASIRNICTTYELGPADATVAVMPLFHGHGLFTTLLASLATGGRVLLPATGRFSAHTFWNDLRAAGATWFTAVPTIYEILLNRAARDFPGPGVAPLRFARSCSAPLNTATARAMERLLGVPLLGAYGMTETAHQAAAEPLGSLVQGSCGRATGVDVRLLDRDGQDVATGDEGEVWVQGPTVARGYLDSPTETAKSFVDGWFRTGDLGRLDANGYLFLTGRIKNLINRGGEKIAPEHVEDVLAGCPGVLEAAVFAIPDPVYGQRVGAAVVVTAEHAIADVTPLGILDHCRGRLPAFEVPDRIDIVDALPHTPKGALDRKAVTARFGH
ncbi:FadD7 family fatty acid--CoA ligase [Amycolatopsis sp. NBC_01488]|uniref:FadD7 family fatty acid--CoA ligase n=1 Tax=Amycolatopsis sp. NBC_01488 TaxID=2903563 RepID=UPI002E2C38F2|nr:FadD7 family fatty acid--CoA ligase [Amycolatopsis sp. NBC_01488]